MSEFVWTSTESGQLACGVIAARLRKNPKCVKSLSLVVQSIGAHRDLKGKDSQESL
jgi:hypothetical protein